MISGGRDNKIIVWKINPESGEKSEEEIFGVPEKQLNGHSHFITDFSLSNDNNYLVSASWDSTMRLWDLNQAKTTRLFKGHTKEVLSCSFSPDNRQIISSSSDKTIKLWNILADCKYTSDAGNHNDWVSCVRYSPILKNSKTNLQPYFASSGWDGKVKIWDTNFQIRNSFTAHKEAVNNISISPNVRYVASGGADKLMNVWDINDLSDPLRSFDAGAAIAQISFNPKKQWVAAATDKGIKIWHLMSQSEKAEIDIQVNRAGDKKTKQILACTSLSWNSQGDILYAGFTDGNIRVYKIEEEGA